MGVHYIGIDPSTVSTGFAIMNDNQELIRYGTINPDRYLDHHIRFQIQYSEMNELMSQYDIQVMVCEEQFAGINIDTLKKITRTSVIPMLIAAQKGIQLHMMYPSGWRKIFHNSGKVTKKDTLALVNQRYGLSLKSKDNDISDAVAMAWCAHQKGHVQ